MLYEVPGFLEARILSVKAHHINSINHSIRKREPRVTVCFDSCAKTTSAPSQCQCEGWRHRCAPGVDVTQVHVVWNTNTTRCTAPVGTGLRRGCQYRPVVILGEFNSVKSVFMSWRTVCKLIVVNFWVVIGSIQIYDSNVTFLISLLIHLQSIQYIFISKQQSPLASHKSRHVRDTINV